MFYYIDCCCLLVSDDDDDVCETTSDTHFIDMFHNQPTWDTTWIFEVHMKCKCKLKCNVMTIT